MSKSSEAALYMCAKCVAIITLALAPFSVAAQIQKQSGVTLCVNSYGGEIETFAKQIIKASTIDTLKFLHDESFELQDRFPNDIELRQPEANRYRQTRLR